MPPAVVKLTITTATDSQAAMTTERVAYDAHQALSGWLDAMGRAGFAKDVLVTAVVSRALLETTDIDTLG